MAARKLPNPPRTDSYGNKIPALLDCRPLKVTGLTELGKPFEPKDGQPGTRISWGVNGESGEIWSLASPRGVFVIPDFRPGVVVHVIDDREWQTFYDRSN